LKQSSGFSLIEVMAAIVILTVAFFPIMAYFTNSIGFVTQREVLSQANNLAVDSIEYLNKEANENSSDFFSTANDHDISYFSNYDLLKDYNIVVNIEHFDKDLNVYSNLSSIAEEDILESLKKISVNVSWDNNSKNYKLETIVRLW
ncbi:MAG: type IV pilus modification PilV family protein, partial [Halanaerobiales bacterium]